MAQFDAHFTTLSTAAAGSNVVQETRVAAATTQYSTIIYNLEALEVLYVAPSGGGGGGSGGGGRSPNFTSDDRAKAAARINQLQEAISGSWITVPASKFCSTHGWGLGPGHDSMSCPKKPRKVNQAAISTLPPAPTPSVLYGSAAAAIRGHGIKPRPTATAGAAGALGTDVSFMAQFYAHFTDLSAAAVGSNVVQESLSTATTQYSAIISKLEALEALYDAPSGSGGGR